MTRFAAVLSAIAILWTITTLATATTGLDTVWALLFWLALSAMALGVLDLVRGIRSWK